jgi:hypothetical protein
MLLCRQDVWGGEPAAELLLRAPHLGRGEVKARPIFASLGLTAYPQVDKLGSLYKFVKFGAEESPVSPHW